MDNSITSVTNPKVKKVVELHHKKGRRQHGCYIIEGIHLIEEAIMHNAIFESLFIEENQEIPDVACCVYTVTADVMKKIATTKTPQPILGVIKKAEPVSLAKERALYLDDVQDPGNVGTILRSSIAFGITHVVCSPHCADLFDPKVVRSAQGAHFQMTYDVCDDRMIKERYQEHQLLVTTLDEAVSLATFSPENKWLLTVGNEGSGIKTSIQQIADVKLKIEASGMESLNVAVATSICLYELTKDKC